MSSRHTKVVMLLVVSLVAACVYWWVAGIYRGQDDAYITYQYARNVAAGHGFVFTAGEPPTYGSTTPLWELTLAGLARLGWAPHRASPAVGGLLYGMSAGFLFLTVAELAGPAVAALAALSWAFCLTGITFIIGLETSLLLVLMSALFWAGVQRRDDWRLTGTLSGLLLLTRPDAAMLVAAVLPFLRYHLRVAAVAFGVYLPWFIYAWRVFGSPIPMSVQAKWVTKGIYQQFSLGRIEDQYFGGSRLLLAAAVALLLVVAVKERRVRPIALWTAAYLALMARYAPDFWWYYQPAVFAIFLLAFAGLGWVAHCLRVERYQLAPALALAAALVWGSSGYFRLVRVDYTSLQMHRDVAADALRLSAPGDTIAGTEVGMLAYYCPGRKIEDLLGLNSSDPEVLRILSQPRPIGRRLAAVIAHTKPRLVTLREGEEILKPLGYIRVAVRPAWSPVYGIWIRESEAASALSGTHR